MRATVLIAATALSFQTLAWAEPITYTQQVIAVGSLGETNFDNALVTISFSGDTANVTNPSPGIFQNTLGKATITVAGIGTATLTDMMGAFVNQHGFNGFAGVTDFTLGNDLLDNINSAFGTYDLTTAIGPLSGSSFLAAITFPTDMGSFGFTTINSFNTYTATTSAVPEPSSYGFVCVGLVIISIYKHRRAVLGQRRMEACFP